MIKTSTFLYRNTHIILFIFFVIISLLLIERYQTPWFDEVYYADITLDLLNNGTFYCPVDAVRTEGQVLVYGPVYFAVNAFIIKILGFGVWQFRLLSVLGALILIYIFLKQTKTTTNFKYAILFIVLIITDRVVNFSLHSGRMDLFAVLLLVFAGLTIANKNTNRWIQGIVAGVFIALASLTTIRICLMLPFLIFLPLFEKEKSDKLKLFYTLTISFIIFIAIYAIWIYYAYGSVNNMIHYISSISLLDQHFSGVTENLFNKFFRKVYEIPKFLLFYASVIYLIKKKHFYNRFLWFSILISFSFTVFVDEVGPYRAMIFPILYFVVIYVTFIFLKDKSIKYKIPLYLAFLVIAGINLLLISGRYVVIYKNWEALSTHNIDKIIKKNIPENAKVVGDFKYYYSCKKNNAKYVSNYELTPKKVYFITNKFKPDFIIESNNSNIYKTNNIKNILPKTIREEYFFPINKIIEQETLLKNMLYNGSIKNKL